MATIDEGDQSAVKIKLTNHLTGEITEIEVTSAEQAKNTLLEIKASMSVFKKAQESLNFYLDNFLGQDEKYQFADGKILRRVQRTTTTYRVETLRKFLDEDQLDVCLKVDMPVANNLIKEMVERGELPPDTMKKIREEADVKGQTPFIEVR